MNFKLKSERALKVEAGEEGSLAKYIFLQRCIW